MLIGFAYLLAAIAAGNAMKCYQCKANVGDCIDGQCTGSWCTAIIVDDKATNTRTVEKNCSQVNPANSGVDGCSTDVSGTSTTQRCGCQIEEFCNSEAGLSRLLKDKNGANSGQVGTGGVPNGNVPPGQQGVNPNAPNAGGDTRPGQPFPVIPPPNQQPPPQNPNQQFPPPGPQPFPGGQGTPNPNGPPPQGIPNGQEFPQPNSNNTPQQPRFPPPQGQPNTPTDFGSNPNNVAPGGGQRPPQSGVNPGSEPELRNFSTTTFSPNAINGGQQADVIPRGDRYNCICNGPPYCSGGRCKGDLCSTIEFATSDIVRSPGSGGQPPQGAGQPVTHTGCSAKMNAQGELSTSRVYAKLPYEFINDKVRVTVPANERFCAGDLCNSSTTMKLSTLALMLSLFVLLWR